MSEQAAVLVTLIAYKLVLLGIGVWAARKMRGEDDFFVGGRGVGGFVSGLSYAASTSSAWVLLGFSGFVYAGGVSALWMVPGVWGGYLVMWLFVAPRLAEASRRGRLVTLTDYLTEGLPARGAARIAQVATAMILVCFVFYIAAQFDAAAKAFTDQFDMGLTEAVLLGAAVILAYSLMGGFWAVSVTDALQAIVMAVVSVGVPLAVLVAAGGPGEVIAVLSAAPEGYLTLSGGRGAWALLGFVFGVLAIGLGPFGQPHLHARLMALKDERARRTGFALSMGWAVIVYSGMAILALAGQALTGGALADGEVLFYRAASAVLPAVLSGVVIAAILSAVMSTVDSVLLSAASAVAHDLGYTKRYPRKALLISRCVMAAIAVLAVALTLALPDSIFNRVLFAWSALGAAFGPLALARVAGQRPGAGVSLASILLGFGVTVVFYLLGTGPGGGVFGEAARLEGDPFERFVPWVAPSLLLLADASRVAARPQRRPRRRALGP